VPPERAAAPSSEDQAAIKARNLKALAERKAKLAAAKASENSRPLPEGWRRVESRSRPGEFVYENIHTEERQAWFPEETAKEEGEYSVAEACAAACTSPSGARS